MSAVSIDLSKMEVLVDRLEEYLTSDIDELLLSIGEMLVKRVVERIKDGKETPSGAPWEMWAESTARYRERKGNASQGILWDNGNLWESIRAELRGQSVAVGSELNYARYIQDGTKNMPAREFLGFGAAEVDEIGSMVGDFIRSAG